ncbi:ABC transporter ATP-binding protein [Alginatibacterium sediminis]|uniref:ABC transporter ATP-binding protein n=1 Tax=Alginatibacterium sediminis TaxID=2164068 RepID=A0A420ECR7_9ALTE|nr:ABC transporter ATP-binding protein [Alginatibacterium sediminis]RKF18466.1 ABC transporter ATP-binding protein [Alginatibacterium sediminis]
MIDVKALDVYFNRGLPIENHVLRGLSLSIEQGQFVTVIGSNGAGKSTLLNALSGDVNISGGEISIGDQRVDHLQCHQRASMVARVFQDPMAGTCEKLSIAENLALAMRRGKKRGLGWALRRQYQQQFVAALSELGLGLEKRLDDQMGLLSGGQRQAVSLLMATLQPMQILLLDEHTAALDPKTAKFVLELSEQYIRKRKLTALMVTHSMQQALDHGDRTIMLHEGQVVFDIHGPERDKMQIVDLLNLFAQTKGEQLSDDSLLLG